MSSNDALYTQLFEKLREFHPDEHLRRITNWGWIVVGLIQSHSVHLSEIAQHIPSDAQAPGRIAQVRRWLANRFIKVPDFYRPLITQAIQAWEGKDVFIILDGCGVNHEKLQFFRMSLSHCYRALPLAWMTLAGAGLVQVEACAPLFAQVLRILPAVASVTFLADRGFRDTDWAEKCLQLGWNYLIRVANNTYVTFRWTPGEYSRLERIARAQSLFYQRPSDQRQIVCLQPDGHVDYTQEARGESRALCGDHEPATGNYSAKTELGRFLY